MYNPLRGLAQMLLGEDAVDCETSITLRNALRQLPTPQVSPGFDARVLQALRVDRPWWQPLRDSMKPMLSGAACSFTIGLVALRFATAQPATTPVAPLSPAIDTAAIERVLDSPNLCAMSLTRLPRLSAPVAPEPRQTPVALPVDPRRRSDRGGVGIGINC